MRLQKRQIVSWLVISFAALLVLQPAEANMTADEIEQSALNAISNSFPNLYDDIAIEASSSGYVEVEGTVDTYYDKLAIFQCLS